MNNNIKKGGKRMEAINFAVSTRDLLIDLYDSDIARRQ